MKNKKIISIVLLFLIIFQNFYSFIGNNIYATDTNLVQGNYCGKHLQYWNANTNSWYYVEAYMVLYNAPNGNQYPAYCIDYGIQGIGDNGQQNQTVNVDDVYKDSRIWRIVTASYPYKSLSELGVTCAEDAYMATRQAIYCILRNRSLDYVKSTFRSAEEGADSRGGQIYNLLVNLVNIGLNGTSIYHDPIGNINQISNVELNGNYYEITYQITGNCNIGNFDVFIPKFPDGTTYEKFDNNKFKIKIPKDKLTSNVTGKIIVNTKLKSYPVFYGKTYDNNLQNYAIASDPYQNESLSTTLSINTGVEIIGQKVATEDNIWTGHTKGQGVAGATYEIRRKSDNSLITTVTTANDGTFKVTLDPGTYTIKETIAPNNFKLDTVTHEFTVDNIYDSKIITLYENVKIGGYLNFTKLSQDKSLQTGLDANSRLSGATYEIRRKLDNSLVTTVTTNSNGTLDNDIKLEKGEYYIKEIKAPTGYQVDPTIKYFSIDYNLQRLTYNFYNVAIPMGTVNVIKKASDDNLLTGAISGSLVANATYEIKDINSKIVSTFTTDSNGKSPTITLNTGMYTMKETKAPYGYYLDHTEYKINIAQNLQNIALNVTNTPIICGLFNFKKTTTDDNLWTGDKVNNPLANATFVIKSNNAEIGDEFGTTAPFELYVTTNNEGTLDQDLKLYKGDYTIQEVKAPNGYYLDTNIYSFSITENKQNIDLDLTNTPIVCGLFNFKKTTTDDNLWTDDKVNNPLANATYLIKSENYEIVDELGNPSTTSFELEVTTNENGTLDKDLMLRKGNYTIQEIKAPEGYYLDTNIYNFNITENKQNIDLDLTNTPIVCGLFNFKKTTTDDNLWTDDKVNNPLANATYLIKSENYEIVDELGNPSTTSFELEVTTNENGTLDKDLMLHRGNYTIQEIKAPNGYYLDTNIYSFSITENKQNIDLDLTNTPIVCGLFNFKKITNDDNLWTKDLIKSALANATFVIRSENAEIGDEFGTTAPFELYVTTNNEGTLDQDLKLYKGDYTIQEVKAPYGYYLDTKTYKFEITENKQNIDLFLTNTPVICGLFSFIKVTTDDNLWTEHLKGNFLANATYLIKSKNYEIVDELGNPSTTSFELEVTTNENGTLDKDLMLRKGNYTIQEVKAPEGYYLDKNIYEFEIRYNKQEIDLDLTNTPIVCGLFNLKKYSEDKNSWNNLEKNSLLPNATYLIRSENYEIVDELGNPSTTSFELEVTTNENGTLDKDLMLHRGNYTIQEVKAPEFYLLDPKIYEFEINENKQVINFEFKNKSIDINIDIDKTGLIQTQANDEIRYNFNTFENNSNIPLDNFTWEDNLPYSSIKITKLFTGVYNYDLDYTVYYKTNKSEDYIKIGTYNTMNNHYIDMTNLNLEENEEITSFMINYGTVPEDFRAVTTPFIFARVRSYITNGDTWTNNTKLYGFYDSKKYVDNYNILKDKTNIEQIEENIYRIEDKASWTTKAYSKKLSIKIHPKTGI